jgi:hypothetical protein
MLLAAGGLGVLAAATPSSGCPKVLAALLLAGTGIGLAMAPATDSVMSSLPLAKASIGSAMNDKTGSKVLCYAARPVLLVATVTWHDADCTGVAIRLCRRPRRGPANQGRVRPTAGTRSDCRACLGTDRRAGHLLAGGPGGT